MQQVFPLYMVWSEKNKCVRIIVKSLEKNGLSRVKFIGHGWKPQMFLTYKSLLRRWS